jgi:uncharacterized membrane protein YraQ (UPF0718 family)
MLHRNAARFIELGGPLLITVFLLWWTSRGSLNGISELTSHFPSSVKDFTTIFLSICLEAIPFVLLGVLVSSFILVFVSEDKIERILPKHPLAAIIPAVLLAAFFPICECAIIPVVKRLIQKGMPSHIGIIFLIVTPIVNPIVFLSTYLAFRMSPAVVYGRMGLAIGVAVIASLFIYYLFKGKAILKKGVQQEVHLVHQENHSSVHAQSKLWSVLYHATDEFFDVGKYVIFGALIAAFAQISLHRTIIGSFGDNIAASSLIMMGLAFLLSICSEADAFVGASFSSLFPPGAIVAFLVFGAIFDVKNTMMLFSVFRTRFVLLFMGLTTLLVVGGSIFFQHYIIHVR